MRLWLTVAVLLIGVLLPCGTEHNVAKRQIRRGGQRGRTTAAPVVVTPEPEYEYDDEEEVPPLPPVSYQRRPVPILEEDKAEEPAPARSEPGTSIRSRGQAPPAAEKSLPDYELPEHTRDVPLPAAPARKPPTSKPDAPSNSFVPDPNNENPDDGGYLKNVVTTSGPPVTFSRRPFTRAPTEPTVPVTSAPKAAVTRLAVRRPKPTRPSHLPGPAGPPARPAASGPPPADDIISKILGGQSPLGGPSPAKPSRTARPSRPTTKAPAPTTEATTAAPPAARGRQGARRPFSRTTAAPKPTEPSEDEEDEEPVAVTAAPARRASTRATTTTAAPSSRRRPGQRQGAKRTTTTAAPALDEEDEEEEVVDKPTTPIPKRKSGSSRVRFAVKPPKPVVVLSQPDDDVDDEYEEQSIPREVTQRAPPTSTTTSRPVSRFGNASRSATAEKKKFRGRFRPKAAADEEDEEDGNEERRYRPSSRSRGRGRGGGSRYRDDDYEDYDEDYDEPPRRNRNRGRDKERNNNNGRRGNRGRGPTTSPRPSTRIPPANLEKRKDGRIVDYLGDPNFPRELSGFSMVDYPFYITLPEDIIFDCDANTDGFYASIPHFCQVFHYCHAGNRYSFLCPNYTLYDQTTFTCRYANTVDCPKSANFFSRNDALYKEKSTEAPITTQLIPDGKPKKKSKSKK